MKPIVELTTTGFKAGLGGFIDGDLSASAFGTSAFSTSGVAGRLIVGFLRLAAMST